jgi:geranylgeranyl pyrophosphate synthase
VSSLPETRSLPRWHSGLPAGEPAPSEGACSEQLAIWQRRLERALDARLPAAEAEPARLHEAMRYSVLGGGKRVRPMLLFCAARAVGLNEAEVEGAACAIELVHVYSLVHDDLPAIDNDDLRRGRATCHKAYDEATAVLVGDALQSLAFQLLASDAALPASTAVRMRLIGLLAEASGTSGMVGGQALDLGAQGTSPPIGEVATMYRLKTGALIRASVLMGAACAPALAPPLWNALAAFAEPIGLAFQIQDDLLDVLGVAATVGKTTGSDRARGKPTYPAVLGVAASQQRVRELHAEATGALRPFGSSADALRALADWLLVRRY